MLSHIMTYNGLLYRTATIGTYQTSRPDALTAIGTHTHFTVKRDHGTTLIDPFMLQAFQAYPPGYNFSKLEDWSRSYYTPEAHLSAITRFSKSYRSCEPVDNSWSQTKQYCFDYFKTLPRVQSLDFNTQLKDIPFEPTSSAGIGYQGRRKGEEGVHSLALKRAVATLHNCRRNGVQSVIEQSTPDAAFTRTQLTKLSEKLKVRNVFGEAFQYVLLEGLSAKPLMDMFSSTRSFFFCGIDPRIGVPELLSQYSQRNQKIANLDWGYFDATVEPWEIQFAFDLLESILDFPNDESLAAFEFSRIFFINRKIAGPDNKVYFKQRGVPSGSFFTMIIDSIVNWVRILYLHHKSYGYFPKDLTTQGDDTIVGVDDKFTPEAFILAFPQDSDWSINPSKCRVGDSPSDVPFLQRYLKFGDQSRDVDKVERLAIYPEYEVSEGIISAYRARALWEDCNYESDILGWADRKSVV